MATFKEDLDDDSPTQPIPASLREDVYRRRDSSEKMRAAVASMDLAHESLRKAAGR
jgi:hypothetical protein